MLQPSMWSSCDIHTYFQPLIELCEGVWVGWEPPERYSCRQIESFNIVTSFQETCVFSFQIICLLGCQCNPKQERSELPLAATTSYKYIPGNTKMKLTLVYNGYCDTFSSMKLDWQGSQEPNRHLAWTEGGTEVEKRHCSNWEDSLMRATLERQEEVR